jgi:hypothetical protein
MPAQRYHVGRRPRRGMLPSLSAPLLNSGFDDDLSVLSTQSRLGKASLAPSDDEVLDDFFSGSAELMQVTL